MKTPREILLKRHEAAEPKLDAISARVARQMEPATEPSLFARVRDLLTLPKLGWSALAAAWVVIISLNFAWREASPSPAASVARAPRSETIEALREQKRIYAELINSGATADVEPRRSTPRPHSARRPETAFA
jgi:hypothetical protein